MYYKTYIPYFQLCSRRTKRRSGGGNKRTNNRNRIKNIPHEPDYSGSTHSCIEEGWECTDTGWVCRDCFGNGFGTCYPPGYNCDSTGFSDTCWCWCAEYSSGNMYLAEKWDAIPCTEPGTSPTSGQPWQCDLDGWCSMNGVQNIEGETGSGDCQDACYLNACKDGQIYPDNWWYQGALDAIGWPGVWACGGNNPPDLPDP